MCIFFVKLKLWIVSLTLILLFYMGKISKLTNACIRFLQRQKCLYFGEKKMSALPFRTLSLLFLQFKTHIVEGTLFLLVMLISD